MSWNYSIYNQGLTLDPSLGTASLPIQQAAAAGSYWVSSIGTGLTYSTLDNAKDPTDGIRAQTNNEFAGLGGAANFASTTEDVRYYHPIVGDVVGMVRAQGGYVDAVGRPAIAAARRLLRRPAAGARLCAQRLWPARHHARHDHG